MKHCKVAWLQLNDQQFVMLSYREILIDGGETKYEKRLKMQLNSLVALQKLFVKLTFLYMQNLDFFNCRFCDNSQGLKTLKILHGKVSNRFTLPNTPGNIFLRSSSASISCNN